MEARYRNLLITIARDVRELKQEVETIQLTMPSEESNGKRNGLRTVVHARNRQRARMMQLLQRNNPALRFFFGTTDPEKIAEEQIKSCNEV